MHQSRQSIRPEESSTDAVSIQDMLLKKEKLLTQSLAKLQPAKEDDDTQSVPSRVHAETQTTIPSAEADVKVITGLRFGR